MESLSFREGVRKRIQMYLGSDDIEGTYQALKEIINNSTDEALAGYGKRIEVDVNEDSDMFLEPHSIAFLERNLQALQKTVGCINLFTPISHIYTTIT